jgi:hypothetical protein
LLTPQPARSDRRGIDDVKIDGVKVNSRLAGLLRRVATTPENNRNNMLNKCAYLAVDELGLGNEIAVRDLFIEAGRQAGLPDIEIETTLKSAGFR